MDVTVVIASYGDRIWRDRARERALPSVANQGVERVLVHDPRGTLAQVRNRGLEAVNTEWVCFLDADDELETGYFDAMKLGEADLRAPSVRYVSHQRRPDVGKVLMPKVVGRAHQHQCTAECLDYGNWLVIGTVARTELVKRVGGFDEYPVYEDYALWAKCWKAGATAEPIPDAIYKAYVRQQSRNRGSMSLKAKHEVHKQIARDLGLVVPT